MSDAGFGYRDGPPPAPDPRTQLHRLLEEDAADLYENAPCGYLSMLPDGTLVKVNRTFCAWTGRPATEIVGARFQELLTVGGRVFHETSLVPLLRMRGAAREIALDLVRVDGSLLPCLLNAVEVRDDGGAARLIRATLFEATARRRYEQELLAAQRAAEESEARARTLHRVVSDLAAAISVDDVAAVIVQRSQAAVHAAGAALVLIGAAPDQREDAPTPITPTLNLPTPPIPTLPTLALPTLTLAAAEGLRPRLLHELRQAAGSRLPLELAQGVRVIPLDDRLRAAQPALAAEMTSAGFSDVVFVPVVADSHRLGLLVLALGAAADGALLSLEEPGTRRVLAPADVDLLWTLGRQAGQALERARLREETARQAERAAFLLDAARVLAGAFDVRETVERVAELAVSGLADLCLIDLTSEQGMVRWAARHADPRRQPMVDELRRRPLAPHGHAHPGARAVQEGTTQWVRSVDDALLQAMAQDPRHLEILRALELESIISVPFVNDGWSLGVVSLGADRRRGAFTAADVEVAEQLALQVALVVDRAQRYELDVRTSHTLQASLLPPPPPAVPGLATAVRYLPATHGVEVGGDFYDVVRLPDDTVAMAVGDVVGHDVTAAATMGQLTSVHRALLADQASPAEVIARLHTSWSLLGLQRMATALFATLEPSSGRLRIASAGHLPPLLVDSGGARFLPVRPGRMLGAPQAASAPDEWVGTLPPGGVLVLFTDGLVESRTADLDAGLARLAAVAAEAATTDPDALCDRLLAELTGAHRADDIALLTAVRTALPPSAGDAAPCRTVPTDPAAEGMRPA